MSRTSQAVQGSLDDSPPFDPPTQVAILRRAVAELVIPKSASPTRLGRLAGDLAVHCVLAQATIGSAAFSASLDDDAALARAQSSASTALLGALKRLEAPHTRQPSRAVLELLQRKVHAALTRLGKLLAAREQVDAESELLRALSMRHAVSDLSDAVLSDTSARANLPWALLVAEAELEILLANPAVASGPDAERRELVALRDRVSDTRREPALASAAKLYPELARPKVLGTLSRRGEVRRHDERALAELAKLLTRRFPDMTLAALAVEPLTALRGMDRELDCLIAELPFDPPRVLGAISRRVGELRACALAS